MSTTSPFPLDGNLEEEIDHLVGTGPGEVPREVVGTVGPDQAVPLINPFQNEIDRMSY